MKALWGLLAAVMIMFPDPIGARTMDCIPDLGCGKGENEQVGKDCCRRPPCEFFFRLMQYKWAYRAALSEKVAAAVVRSRGTFDWIHTMIDAEMEERRQFGGKCPRNDLWEEPPDFSVDIDSCETLVRFPGQVEPQPFTDLQDVLDRSNSCTEFVLDELRRVTDRKVSLCSPAADGQADSSAQSGGAIAEFVGMSRSLETEIREMEAHLSRYCGLCTCAPEAELARWVVQYANPPLKDPPNKKRPPKKTPKRAGKKSG